MILGKVELLVMAILLSENIAQCGDRTAVGWAWTGRNLILDEALCGHNIVTPELNFLSAESSTTVQFTNSLWTSHR